VETVVHIYLLLILAFGLMEWLSMKRKKFQMMKSEEEQDLNLFLHQDRLQI
jgi:hypothetical protein